MASPSAALPPPDTMIRGKDEQRRPFWFHARRYGYGAGWPLNWKGWTLWAAMLAVLAAVPYGLDRLLPLAYLMPATIAAITFVTLAFLWIAKGRTAPRRRGPR